MPVRIPEIKRIGPQDPASVGRISTEVVDPTRANALVDNAVEKTTNLAGALYQKVENEQADLTSMQAAVEYESERKKSLNAAKSWQGDPTEIYAKYDEAAVETRNKVLEKYNNVNDKTKERILSRLQKADFMLADTKAVQYSVQQAAFDKSTTDADIALGKEGMHDAISIVDIEEPESFNQLHVQIDRVKRSRIEYGKRQGLVTVDKDGNEVYSDQIKLQIKKDVSEGLSDVITTLNAAGKTEEAKAVIETYGSDLLADTKVKLLTKNKDAEVKNQAFVVLDKHLNDPDAFRKISSNKSLEPEVREKALELFDAHKRREENNRELMEKTAMDKMVKVAEDKKFLSFEEAKNNPDYLAHYERLSAKGKKEAKKIFDAPATSDEDAKNSAYEAAASLKGLAGMSRGEFSRMTALLSKEDRAPLDRKWLADNTESGAEQSARYGRMTKTLEEKMFIAGMIKKDFTGKFTKKSVEALNGMRQELLVMDEQFGANKVSLAEQEKFVAKFVEDKIKGNVFNGVQSEPSWKFGKDTPAAATPDPSAPKGPPPPSNEKPLSLDEKRAWLKKWYEVKGSAYPVRTDVGQQALKKFIKEQGGKL